LSSAASVSITTITTTIAAAVTTNWYISQPLT
jgi:hypothetical protein